MIYPKDFPKVNCVFNELKRLHLSSKACYFAWERRFLRVFFVTEKFDPLGRIEAIDLTPLSTKICREKNIIWDFKYGKHFK